MPTKRLLALTISMVLLTGIAFGFGIDDMITGSGPKTTTEKVLTQAVKSERQNPTSPADDFRVQANNLTAEYVTALTTAAGSVARGGQPSTATAMTETPIQNLSAWYGRTLGQANQNTLFGILQNQVNGYLAYAVATHSSNPVDGTNAAAALSGYDQSIAEFFARLDTSNATGTYQQPLDAARQSILQAIDAFARNNTPTFLTAQQNATRQFNKATDTFVIRIAALPGTHF